MANDRLSSLFEALQDTSPRYAKLATNLSNGIEAFESFLLSLPGKIETCVYSSSPTIDLGLRFVRLGKSWNLQVGINDSDGPPDCDHDGSPILSWASLREARLELKIEATTLFEGLLAQLLEIQQQRLEKLSRVDGFIRSLGTGMKEGGNEDFPL